VIWLTFLPAALTLVLALALGLLPLPLHPVWAARVLVTVAGSAAFATIGTLVFVTVNYAATLFPHAAARLPEWALFGDDQPVHTALGAPAAGILPALRPLNARLRFALERWADEDAAEAVGDRRLVARTIAQVALARSPNGPGAAPFPAFTDSGVLRRVQALLGTAPAKNTITGPVILTGAGLGTGLLASAAWQLDHALGLTFL
jgi:hypothetical protein